MTTANIKELTDILRANKKDILKTWRKRIIETYPKDAQRYYLAEGDEFANPVGSSVSQGLDALFDAVCDVKEPIVDELYSYLDKIIRMRAVQDFSAAQSTFFVFTLKDIIRDVVFKKSGSAETLRQLLTFESRIDKVALLAFNNFMQCREKIYELRSKEIRERTSRIVQRACQILGSGREALEDEPTD